MVYITDMRRYGVPIRYAVSAVAAVLFLSVPAWNSPQSLAREESSGTRAEVLPSLPGEAEIRALAEAYPGRIGEISIRGGEWTLRMDGRRYCWANGRLLPEEERARREQYVSIRFYSYELGPFVPREITPELAARLRERSSAGAGDSRLRFNGFLDALYGISSREEAERTVVPVTFFGRSTRVHPLLREPLARVETRIGERMRHDREVRDFVEGLNQAAGYNWRNIAGTLRRSYHSYGIAIDLIPVRYGRGYAYWRWALDGGVREWWELGPEDRWHVPQPVIDAFEAEGFIWGGKWLSFDNIHFEYRPETILMARRLEAGD